MKLRHQSFLLLGLPIICQLITTGILICYLSRLDEAVKQEATAKEVVGICQEIHGLLGQAVLEVTGAGLLGQGTHGHSRVHYDQLSEKTMDLLSRVRGNKEASATAEKFQHDSARYLKNWEDLRHAYKSNEGMPVFSQFFELRDYVESMKVQFDQVTDDLTRVKTIYGAVAAEFTPEARHQRQQLRYIIIAAISLNVMLVTALAIIFNRNTLSRLKVLMSNMQAFSQGSKEFHRLRGNDELAELDQSFKDMADERNKLDEIRKSMLAMVAHDLKSPLASVGLTVDLILDLHTATLSAAVSKYLHRISSQIQRLSRMARTLLDVEQIEGGTLEVSMKEHDCADIVGPAISAISALAEQKHIEIHPKYEGQSNLVCDEDRTIQVLVNFLSNAIKFAPEHSAVTIRSDVTEEGSIKFEVLDEGPGVPPDKVDSLFMKFRQLDQPEEVKKQGSGLGLYICRMLIVAQGGQVGYTSAGEKGSCFWFKLPGKMALA
jgi:signal transduction histidine kinase